MITITRGGMASNLVLLAAVVAGVSYMASWNMDLPLAASAAWKGAAVSLLALYAGLRAEGRDGWLLCAALAFYALGDVLLEVIGLTRGAVAFLIGHLVAIALYWRNRDRRLTMARLVAALAIVPATVVISYLLPADRSFAPGVAFYAFGLSLMAAAAIASRFNRAGVGLGAVLFVISDLLIFARAGPLEGEAWVGFGVWGLYLAANLLICLGVTRVLSRKY
ncbi:lysoplasmalogenase family protein [Caulobacter sp. NIBR2454]|uniref:lysoplasmalogenase family protein n=1 Tax=Caulobacter sp. NIBR2454 TaxID=3015996 RepID=UPI0022B6C62D|nr:lysoplasmalogenase family protein [Caulobacter sp. NIBR2454]